MIKICVSDHVLYRWRKRIGGNVTKEHIERAIRRGYNVIEPGWKGRLIINCDDKVFVISKTRTKMVVHTVYCSYEDYKEKRHNIDKAFKQYEILKWEQHQNNRSRLKG